MRDARKGEAGLATQRAVTAVVVSLLALGFAAAVVNTAWRAPDKGFWAFTRHRVAEVDRTGAAYAAGLRVGDVIVAVDSKPVDSTFEYVRKVLSRRSGDVVLDISRQGVPHRFTIPLNRYEPPWSAIAATIMACMFLALGLIARLGRPSDITSIRFWRTTIVYAAVYVGGLCYTDLLLSPALTLICLFAVFFAGPIAMDMTLVLPTMPVKRASLLRRVAYTITIVLCAAAAAALGSGVLIGGTMADTSLLWFVHIVTAQLAITVTLLLLGLLVQLRRLRQARGDKRAQLLWLTLGFFAATVPAVVSVPEAAHDLDRFLVRGYQPYLAVMAALYFAAITLAVLRVGLAEVQTVIRRSVVYAITSGLALFVYMAFALGLGLFADRVLGRSGILSHFVGAATAALLFWPIRGKVTTWLDRRFQRDRLHYMEAIRELSETVLHLREMGTLTRRVVEATVSAIRARSGALYLSDPNSGGKMTLRHARGGAYPPEISLESSWDGTEDLSVEIRGGNEGLAGRLILGPRLDGELYSIQDKDLLGALGAQLSIALENASAFGTIAGMTQTLERQNGEIRELRDRLEDENRYLKERLDSSLEQVRLVGSSKTVRELKRQTERAALSTAIVLLRGETGVGKGLVARAIHDASERSGKPFIHVDLGAIPQGVFESELFGHERGAFTGASRARRGLFELADGGTLLLDEIGELPLEMQPKILRAVQERSFMRVGGSHPVHVDVRILAATHRDLAEMVRQGTFREDLYYRLSVLEISVPPLRSRRGDIPELVEALTPRLCRRNHKPSRRLTEEALVRMAAYGWPGNIRELENVLERAIVLCESGDIRAEDLALPDRPLEMSDLTDRVQIESDAQHRDVMEAIEKDRILAALRAHGGNRSSAARALGLPRTTLINKMRRYGLAEGFGIAPSAPPALR